IEFEEKMKDEAKILVFTQETECPLCKETRELVQEIAALSGKIKVEIYDFIKDSEKAKEYYINKIPAIALVGKKDYGIRFFGAPAGYEVSPFIEDIIDVCFYRNDESLRKDKR
ncbi:MAG: thioredoxin family protein, partial [Euryarchaeota archaeon]|nr:thioredoxin family protein [Euryarchaeota archaeon]